MNKIQFLNFITFIVHCVKGTSMRSNRCCAAVVTEILCKSKLYFNSIYSNTTFIHYIHMLKLIRAVQVGILQIYLVAILHMFPA